MKRLSMFVFSFISLLFIGFYVGTKQVYAEELNLENAAASKVHATEVDKETILQDYMKQTGVSYEQAHKTLFPNVSLFRSADDGEVSYVQLRTSFQDDTLLSHIPNNAGQVYFYCEVSKSGWFRGIRRIVYAGYNSGNLVFSGNFRYALPDPNRIHFTLSGALYRHTTTTVSVGGGIGIGQSGSFNVGISNSSNFARSLYYHGNRSY